MKTITTRLCILLNLILFNQTLLGQATESLEAIPKEINYLANLPDSIEDKPWGFSKFHPVGWSTDQSHFAYCVKSMTDAIGHSAEFIIINVRTGKQVVHLGGEGQHEFDETGVKELWINDQDTISKLLNKFDIQPVKLDQLAFTNQKHKLIIDVVKDTLMQPNQIYFNCKELNVVLLKSGVGTKRIHSDSSDGHIIDAYSLGVLIHLKTGKGLALVDKRYRGWEGGSDSVLLVVPFDSEIEFSW